MLAISSTHPFPSSASRSLLWHTHRHMRRPRPPHHGRLIMTQRHEPLPQLILQDRCTFLVRRRVQPTCRSTRCEPVPGGEAFCEREEVLLNLLGGEGCGDFGEGL